MELVDVMRSQHACRYYKPDPVPENVLYDAVDTARFGPQGGNRQPVRFLIVTDPQKKEQLGEWYRVPWKAALTAAAQRRAEAAAQAAPAPPVAGSGGKAPWVSMSNPEKGLADADNFADNFGRHPAIIVVCVDLDDTQPTDKDLGRLSIVGGASVYPMAQNLCLALRNQGVATTMTTILCMYEPQVKELLGIPENLSTAAFIVAGYPAQPFPTKLLRRPVEDIAFLDGFDRPLSRRA